MKKVGYCLSALQALDLKSIGLHTHRLICPSVNSHNSCHPTDPAKGPLVGVSTRAPQAPQKQAAAVGARQRASPAPLGAAVRLRRRRRERAERKQSGLGEGSERAKGRREPHHLRGLSAAVAAAAIVRGHRLVAPTAPPARSHAHFLRVCLSPPLLLLPPPLLPLSPPPCRRASSVCHAAASSRIRFLPITVTTQSCANSASSYLALSLRRSAFFSPSAAASSSMLLTCAGPPPGTPSGMPCAAAIATATCGPAAPPPGPVTGRGQLLLEHRDHLRLGGHLLLEHRDHLRLRCAVGAAHHAHLNRTPLPG